MGTVLVAAAVFGALGYTVFHLVRKRKKGGCAGCPSCGDCTACGTNRAR